MRLTFHSARVENARRPAPFDLLLGLVAVFEVVDGQSVLYREIDLPIVELAVELKKWLNDGLETHAPFDYRSVEADEIGMLWIHREGTGWLIGSIYQESADSTVKSDDEVRSIVERFVREVQAELLLAAGQPFPA